MRGIELAEIVSEAGKNQAGNGDSESTENGVCEERSEQVEAINFSEDIQITLVGAIQFSLLDKNNVSRYDIPYGTPLVSTHYLLPKLVSPSI